MSADTRNKIQFWITVLMFAGGPFVWVITFSGNNAVASKTVDDHEKRIVELERREREGHDTLIEIRNDLSWIVQTMGGKPRPPSQ